MVSCDYYPYIIYGVLGVLCIASEALGLTKSIKPNSITEAIMNSVKSVMIKKITTIASKQPEDVAV